MDEADSPARRGAGFADGAAMTIIARSPSA
jgi:hypothetical protein